jgi:ribosomal-protein-alanine N-acetyltransferase
VDHRLETPRLALVALTLADVGSLHALMVDPDVRRWAADGRVLPEASVRAAILKSIATFRRHGTGAFALRVREDGAFAGYAGLLPSKLARLGGLELGAAIWPRYWRQGFAAEACRAVLTDAFDRLGVERVLACADAPNFRSLALIARLGFHQIGTTPGVFGAIRWFLGSRSSTSTCGWRAAS